MLKEPSALTSNPSYTGATPCPDQWRRFASCEAVCWASSGLVAIALRSTARRKALLTMRDYRAESVTRHPAIVRFSQEDSMGITARCALIAAAVLAGVTAAQEPDLERQPS